MLHWFIKMLMNAESGLGQLTRRRVMARSVHGKTESAFCLQYTGCHFGHLLEKLRYLDVSAIPATTGFASTLRICFSVQPRKMGKICRRRVEAAHQEAKVTRKQNLQKNRFWH